MTVEEIKSIITEQIVAKSRELSQYEGMNSRMAAEIAHDIRIELRTLVELSEKITI